MVEIIRKGDLPQPGDVPEALRAAAATALSMTLREPRPAGFPLLFSSNMQLIEPAVAFLHEHAIQRAHTSDTLRTYLEILYDWFDALEQSAVLWNKVDAGDLIAYRNRMLKYPSPHTGRPYSVRTINHRVRGVLRFYEWAVRNAWLPASPLVGRAKDFGLAQHGGCYRRQYAGTSERSIFVLRQFQSLPRPLTNSQARELLAELLPPYDLMARWQLYTGLRISEVLRLNVRDVLMHRASPQTAVEPGYRRIDIVRKGRKPGYVIASRSLLEETSAYLIHHRASWLRRTAQPCRTYQRPELFINPRGSAVKKNTYQKVVRRTALARGFRATPHLLRATFCCMLLARLEQLAKRDAAINPLLIAKILMGHEHIDTTDGYLRAVAVDSLVLADVLDRLLAGRSSC